MLQWLMPGWHWPTASIPLNTFPMKTKPEKPRKGSGLESSFILGIGARGSDLNRVTPVNQISHLAVARYARRARLAGILVSRRLTAVVSQRDVLVTRSEGSKRDS